MINYLNEENKVKYNKLKELYYQYETNLIKSTNETSKQCYRSKLVVINEISIMFFNIDLTE